MIMYSLGKLDNAMTPQFCWRPEWISPYESPWSIFEKFKYANLVGAKDIMKYFANNYVQTLKTIAPSYYNLVTLDGFDQDKLKLAFKYDIVGENDKNLKSLIGFLPDYMLHGRKKLSYFLRSNIAFCPSCFETGFHSILHQLKFVYLCPYHEVPLEKSCPNCNQTISYELSDKCITEPFQCVCGYSFLNNLRNERLINWRQYQPTSIICKKINKWLSLTEDQKNKLQQYYLFPDLELEQYEGVMDFLLKVLDPRYQMDTPDKYHMVFSSPYINNLRGTKEKKEATEYYKKKFPFISENEIYNVRYQTFQKEMYNSYMKTLSGIAKHFRKSIFMNHKKCIYRLINYKEVENVCPYAYTYIHWRSYVQNFPNLKVDSRFRPRREYKSNMEFPPIAGEFLYNIYDDLKGNLDDITTVNTSLKWIFNRLIVHFAMHHLNNWWEISQVNAENKLSIRFLPNEFNRLPFFLLKISFNNNECHEFHWLIEEDMMTNELSCPFKTVSSKREKGRSQRIKRIKHYKGLYF